MEVVGTSDEKVAVMLSLALKPIEPFPGQNVGWKSLCSRCGAQVAPHYSSLVNAIKNGIDRSCRECGARRGRLTKRKADLKKLLGQLPEVGFRLVGDYQNAKTPTSFECLECGLETTSTSDSLLRGGKTCKCKKRPRQPLSVFAPQLAGELCDAMNGELDASRIGTGMRSNVWWKCPAKGHVYEATPAARFAGKGCRFCAGIAAYEGESDLATTHPELFKELASDQPPGVTAATLKSGSNRIANWTCLKNPNHVYPCSPYDRTVRGTGCSYCAGKRVLPGDNDLLTKHPDLAEEWDYEKNYPQRPEQFTSGSNKSFGWICSWNPNHKWDAAINTRSRGHGCQKCSWVKTGENDLATQASRDPSKAHLLEDWDYARNTCLPNEVAFSSSEQYWWKCAKSLHDSYLAKPSNRWFAYTGCPSCAPSAYSTSKPGRFYFLYHKSRGALKFGITNITSKTDRIRKFQGQGWIPQVVIEDQSGLFVKLLERRMLHIVRFDWGLSPSLSREDMASMGGATETFSNPPLSLGQICKLIRNEAESLKHETGI